MPRSIWLFVFALLPLLTPAARAQQNAAPQRPPNVILIVADDLGYADVGCNGCRDIRTPRIDSLAKDGSRFTNFCVAQAVCTASRAALMSGCYPNRIGLSGALNHTSTVGIHPDEFLLPEMFKAQGYATACYGKWHLGTRPEFFPTRNGFGEWAGLPYSNDNGPLHPTVRGIPALPFYRNDKVIETDPDQAQLTNRLTDYAVEFIGGNKDRPFFLYLPHVMPHVPIFASSEFKGKSSRGLYGDVVQQLDAGVGKVLATLKTLKLEQNTLVIFMSDNGPFLSYGDHAGRAEPFREGKLTTFEGGLRVPFLARWPGKIPAGRAADEFMSGLDLLPTLAKIADGKLPTNRKIDGIDLSPLLLGQPKAKGRELFACYAGAELHAVRNGPWKLHLPHEYLTVDGPPGKDGKPANFANMKPRSIQESGIRGIASRHGYRVEKLELSLFNLQTDRGEQKNVAADHPQIVAELQQLAADFRNELGDSLTQAKGTGLRSVGNAGDAKEVKPERKQAAVEIKQRHGQSWRGTVDGLSVLMLRGTHRERGEAHGRLAGAEIVKSCNQLATMLQKKLPGGWSTAVIIGKQFQLPKRYREELEGMLAGIEQSTTPEQRTVTAAKRAINVEDLALLNTADVFELFRCSQFSAWGPAAVDGKLIVGRNFDYPPILPRENFCLLAIEPSEPGLRPTVDALFFGFVGCGLTAINSEGMYIAPNSGGPSPREILPKEPIAAGFILRNWLETSQPSTAIEELTEQIKPHFALPILLHVVPAKSELDKQTPIILEFEPSATAPSIVIRKPEEGVPSLFVANHHVKNAADLERGRCGILKSECEKCLASGRPIDFDAALKILHAARQDTTYVSAVTWPHEGRMKVAIAEPGKVATESRFYEVDWQAIRAAK